MGDPVQNTPNPSDGKPTGDDNPSKDMVIELEIDGEKKTFSPEDVTNLLAQQAGATKATQAAAAIVDAAKKYNMTPEEYVGHSEGAFSTLTKLNEDGIVDETGKIVTKKEPEGDPDKVIPKTTPADKTIASAKLRELETTVKGLAGITDRVSAVEEDVAGVLRGGIQEKILKEYPVLNKEDVSKIFGSAMADRNKTVWDHAKDAAEAKKVSDATTRAHYAKEFGVKDLAKFDANKLLEQDGNAGASAVVVGKKISFKAKPGDPNSITPRQATTEFLKRLAGG